MGLEEGEKEGEALGEPPGALAVEEGVGELVGEGRWDMVAEG